MNKLIVGTLAAISLIAIARKKRTTNGTNSNNSSDPVVTAKQKATRSVIFYRA